MKRKASAVWKGGLKDGKGRLSTATGVLSDTPYSFSDRFGDGEGTNPEELIAAAHAGCYAMALSLVLGEANITADRIDATAAVSLDKTEGGFAITAVHLDVQVTAPGADAKAVAEATEKAKAGCPVSKVLNAPITMNSRFNG